MDFWGYKEINSGSREGDTSKVDTLGPYCRAFGLVVNSAAMNREDIKEMKKLLEDEGCLLFRGTGLTEEELKTYSLSCFLKSILNLSKSIGFGGKFL